MRTSALRLCLLLAALPAFGQTTDPRQLADDPEIVAWKILKKQGITPDNVEDFAKRRLVNAERNTPSSEPLYDLQRVEVTGVSSRDDTDDMFPGMFDKQIKPSFLNEDLAPRTGVFDKALGEARDAWGIGEDMDRLIADRDGKLSDRAKQVLDDLKGKEINELVCHSWGTEVVYSGIFSGYIKPPRELFVLAPTDANVEKWRVLAEKTGTVVHVMQGSDDLKIKASGLVRTTIPAQAALTAAWNAQCGRIDCDPHYRVERGLGRFQLTDDVPTGGHDRRGYMALLSRPGGPLSRSAKELAAPQDARIELEGDQLLADALDQADKLVARARGERLGESPFADDATRLGAARLRAQQDVYDTAAALKSLEENVARAEATRRREAEEEREEREWLAQADTFRYLASVVRMACDDPDSFESEIRGGNYASVGMERRYLASYLGQFWGGHGITPCQDEVLHEISDASGLVSGSYVLAGARAWRAKNPTVLEQIGQALQELRAAADNVGARGSGSASYGDGSGRSSSSDERSGSVWHGSSAAGQASGINLSGSGFD